MLARRHGSYHVCGYAVKLPYGLLCCCSGRQTDIQHLLAVSAQTCALGDYSFTPSVVLSINCPGFSTSRTLHSSLLRVTAGPFRRAQVDMSVCRCERVPSRLPRIG